MSHWLLCEVVAEPLFGPQATDRERAVAGRESVLPRWRVRARRERTRRRPKPSSKTGWHFLTTWTSSQCFLKRPNGGSCPAASALQRAAALDQPLFPHHPQDALAVDRHTEPASHERGDHAVPVGLARDSLRDERGLDPVGDRTRLRSCSRGRDPVDRLPADLQNTRHRRRGEAACDQFARPGDALAHSQPRNASPAISSS